MEADALLRGAGLELGIDDVQALVTHCEGWPAALYLAALATRGGAEEWDRFGGHHHVISDYLRAEILDSLPAELVEFAIRSSVLDELAGPICDLTLNRRGSAAALKRLERCNPLLLPVDGAHHTYRWHNLMAETLRSELRRVEPELEPELRLRASGWYSSHGDAPRAITHAAAARDAGATGDLLWRDILGYLTSGRKDLVRDWLANFSSEEIADHTALALSASISALVAGDFNEMQRWSLAAGAALARDGGDDTLPSVSTGLAVTDAAGAHGGVSKMAEAALSAARAEPEDSLWRPLCSLLAGVGRHLQGERVAAEFLLDEAIRLCGSGAPMLASLGLAQRAMIAIEAADWDTAGRAHRPRGAGGRGVEPRDRSADGDRVLGRGGCARPRRTCRRSQARSAPRDRPARRARRLRPVVRRRGADSARACVAVAGGRGPRPNTARRGVAVRAQDVLEP